MHIFKGNEFVSPLQQHWHAPKLRVLFLSIFWRFLMRGLFIFHSHWFIQHFILKNMAKMHIFKDCEFVSPLQQHWHTPKLRVLFLSIFWRFLMRGLFIFHSHWFIQHFILKNMAKMHIFKDCEFVSPLQQHWHTPKLRGFFLSIFWRFLLRGLFIFHSHWFIQHFILKNMAKMHTFKDCEFVSPLQQHWHTPKRRRFLLRGLLIFHSHWLYNILFLKTWWKYFLSVDYFLIKREIQNPICKNYNCSISTKSDKDF